MNNLSIIIFGLCVVTNALALPAQEELKAKPDAVIPQNAEVPAEAALELETLKAPNAEVKPADTGSNRETLESQNADARPVEELKTEMGPQISETQPDGFTPESEDTLVPDEYRWGGYRKHRGYWVRYGRPWVYSNGWGYGGGWGHRGGWGYGRGWGGYGYGRYGGYGWHG